MSSPSTRVHPDGEAAVLDWLRQCLPHARCVTELPTRFEEQLPVIRATRVGGPTDHKGLTDNPRVDLEFYAASREQAADLALQAQAFMHALRGVTIGGAVVCHVADETGLAWRPEYNPRVRRYGAVYALTIRPE